MSVKQNYCDGCGVQLRTDSTFCHNCGRKVSDLTEGVENLPSNSKIDEISGLISTTSLQSNLGVKKQVVSSSGKNIFLVLLVVIVLAAGGFFFLNNKSDPNADADYARNPSNEGSIANLISQACSNWSDIKKGPDLSEPDESYRETDFEYRKNVTVVSFDRLDMAARSGNKANTYLYLSEDLLGFGYNANEEDFSAYPQVEVFCASSLQEQLQPYLESLGVGADSNSNKASTNNSDNSSVNVQPTPTKPTGHYELQCQTMEYPNPNYDPYKGPSAIVNEPTIKTRNCSQVWVTN